MLWTWTSPNLEFATVFVGVLGVAAFGLSFWQAAVALTVGTVLGSITHAVLSAQGPKFGVPQMIASRIPFGFRGNWLPAGSEQRDRRHRLVRGQQREWGVCSEHVDAHAEALCA